MKRFLLSAGLAAACATSAPAQDEHAVWVPDFDQAVALAKAQGKDLFVDFTGSDWCGWCIKLHEEVFQFEEFLKPAQQKFILVALDFPNSEEVKAKVPNPERNAELAEKYGVQGYPTCLLMTAEGHVFGRTGYQEGGAEKYVEHLAEIGAAGKKALAAVAELKEELQAAKDKLPVLEKALAMLEGMDPESIGIEVLVELAEQALAADPSGEKGLKLRAMKALLHAGKASDAVVAAARTLDPKNEHGLLELVVGAAFQHVTSEETARAAVAEIEALLALGSYQDEAKVKEMAAMAAIWCERGFEDPDRAKKLAEQAVALTGELNEGLAAMLQEILG